MYLEDCNRRTANYSNGMLRAMQRAPRRFFKDKWQARLVGRRVCRKIYRESNERSESRKKEHTVVTWCNYVQLQNVLYFEYN